MKKQTEQKYYGAELLAKALEENAAPRLSVRAWIEREYKLLMLVGMLVEILLIAILVVRH